MAARVGMFMIKDSIPYAHPLFFFWVFVLLFIIFRKGFNENYKLKRELELEKIKYIALRRISRLIPKY